MTSRLLTLVALVLLALAGWLAFAPPVVPPPFLVEGPDRDLRRLPVGVHEVAFRITNPAAVPRRIIGLAEG